MDKIKMRPNTPVFTADFKRDDDIKDENYDQKMKEQAKRDKRRMAIILLQRLIRGRAV